MKVKIGNVSIEKPVVVAPMAGVTDLAYRSILKTFEPGLIYTEMISDKGLLFENHKTHEMIQVVEENRPIVLQLFGSDIESMVRAAKYIDIHSNADIIDINMGCPVPKVVKPGAGSALMKTPELAFDIVQAVVQAVKKPVTVKIRSGWDFSSINAVEMAKGIEAAGASAIAIHGRTRTQMYGGKADLDVIKAVKSAVSIPVIGNGDITSPEDAKHMLDYTGVDMIMIGRGLMGNPWLIKQINDYLETGQYQKEISLQEKRTMFFKHLDNLVRSKGERIAVLEMRTHGAWYIKGLKHASKIKPLVVKAETVSSLLEIINNYFDQLENEYSK